MKAIVYEKYGTLDVLELKEVEKPTPKDNEVLIKTHATAINFADSGLVRGKPYMGRLWSGLFKPKNPILGADVAGRVEAVGKKVKQFQPGDEVYGDLASAGWGGFAEYVTAPENLIVLKPVNLSFEEAAALPQVSVVAHQGLRDQGKIQAGQKVVINGASGAIGSIAVQIAKSYGAEVTGICSTRNVDMVRSIGADKVIDYTKENFTKSEQRYDLILDIAVSHKISDYKRVLNPKGIYVAAGFNPVSLFLGPLISLFGKKKVCSLICKAGKKDLIFMKELVEAGKVVPVIGKRYPLSEVAAAIQNYEEGTQGKIVVTVADENKS